MSEKDWLDTATEKIRFTPDRRAVRRELEAHLADLREASGLEPDAVLQAMGDPEAIAEDLGRLHRPWSGYLWRTSQIMLAAAAITYCLILAILLVDSGRSYLFPGRKLYTYLNWDGRGIVESKIIQNEREIPFNEVIKTGGVTIRVDHAALCQTGEDGSQQDLYLELSVHLGWHGEPLDSWYAISDVRDSTGTVRQSSRKTVSASWAYHQKIALAVIDIPEASEWAEIDFGYGELRRTLHIDLTEGAVT